MRTPREVPARPPTGNVSGATENKMPKPERCPFSREYLDYWVPLPDFEA